MVEISFQKNLQEKGQYDLKQSRGGIADIEFLTQYLVLKLASIEPAVTISRNTSELLACLADNEKLSDPRLKDLIAVYADLLRLVNINALQNSSYVIDIKELESVNIQIVNQLWSDLLD